MFWLFFCSWKMNSIKCLIKYEIWRTHPLSWCLYKPGPFLSERWHFHHYELLLITEELTFPPTVRRWLRVASPLCIFHDHQRCGFENINNYSALWIILCLVVFRQCIRDLSPSVSLWNYLTSTKYHGFIFSWLTVGWDSCDTPISSIIIVL